MKTRFISETSILGPQHAFVLRKNLRKKKKQKRMRRAICLSTRHVGSSFRHGSRRVAGRSADPVLPELGVRPRAAGGAGRGVARRAADQRGLEPRAGGDGAGPSRCFAQWPEGMPCHVFNLSLHLSADLQQSLHDCLGVLDVMTGIANQSNKRVK